MNTDKFTLVKTTYFKIVCNKIKINSFYLNINKFNSNKVKLF